MAGTTALEGIEARKSGTDLGHDNMLDVLAQLPRLYHINPSARILALADPEATA